MEKKHTETRIEMMKNDKAIFNFGFVVTAFFSFAATFGFTYLGILDYQNEPFYSVLFIALAITFFVLAEKYITNKFHKKYVVVNNKTLKVVYNTWGKFRESEFELKKIIAIKFIDKENLTNHSLTNETMNCLGFGTAEREMQYMKSKGAIEIKTKDNHFRFGKDIPSWEADRFIMLVEKAMSRA